MMKDRGRHKKNENAFLVFKSILLSCLIHGAVISNFTFVLPLYRPPAKPVIQFLGSILRKREIYYSRVQPSKTKQSKAELSFVGGTSDLNKNPFEASLDEKPSTTSSFDHNGKLILKSTFLESEQTQRAMDRYHELGIQVRLQPYRPLRLNTP